MNIASIFMTGLFAGGLTCMAVQGGLLLAVLTQSGLKNIENSSPKKRYIIPIASFLVSKILSHALLGFFLGLFGSFFQLSITAQFTIQLFVGFFMIGVALNLLNVHPIFRYFLIQPPKFLSRYIRRASKNSSFFAPAFIGVLTIFIPCGTTQAMMALAISSANPVQASIIMLSFTLGTAPLFFILSLVATRLSRSFEDIFSKAAATVIIILALFNINSALKLSGTKYTLSYFIDDIKCTIFSVCKSEVLAVQNHNSTDQATINFLPTSYNPNSITVNKGSEVILNLVNEKGYGCIQAFTIPKLNIQKIVRVGTKEVIKFKAPDIAQDIKFMCSMGMYEGVIHVI